jgi:hypothetical protein
VKLYYRISTTYIVAKHVMNSSTVRPLVWAKDWLKSTKKNYFPSRLQFTGICSGFIKKPIPPSDSPCDSTVDTGLANNHFVEYTHVRGLSPKPECKTAACQKAFLFLYPFRSFRIIVSEPPNRHALASTQIRL